MSRIADRYPFIRVDAKRLASGMLEMFDDNERTVLRFGMLPREKIDSLENAVRKRVIDQLSWPPSQDVIELTTLSPADNEYTDHGEQSLKQIVSDIVHEVCIEIYKIGELVV